MSFENSKILFCVVVVVLNSHDIMIYFFVVVSVLIWHYMSSQIFDLILGDVIWWVCQIFFGTFWVYVFVAN